MRMPSDSSFDENAIRDALRAARVTGPLPSDVSARLDEVLADLQRERAEADQVAVAAPEAGRVAALATRRRRPRAALLAAAAAIVAGVATAPTWWPPASAPETSSNAASDAPDTASLQADEKGPDPRADLNSANSNNLGSVPGSAESYDAPLLERQLSARSRGALSDSVVTELTSGPTLTDQVTELLEPSSTMSQRYAQEPTACPGSSGGPTSGGLPVALDGTPGWLTHHPRRTQTVVRIVDCTGRQLARLVLH